VKEVQISYRLKTISTAPLAQIDGSDAKLVRFKVEKGARNWIWLWTLNVIRKMFLD
jgi:hypothetical protein